LQLVLGKCITRNLSGNPCTPFSLSLHLPLLSPVGPMHTSA
jgi:hypothetical protein